MISNGAIVSDMTIRQKIPGVTDPCFAFTGRAVFFFEEYGNRRDLHVGLHSFPTRRSSDLSPRDRSGRTPPAPRAARRWKCCTSSTTSRSEEHTSELQSQSHISYAVFCL